MVVLRVALLAAFILSSSTALLAQTLDGAKVLGEVIIVDREGRERPLSTFAGKAVFVNIWANWCPPCIREMPSIVRLREKLRGQNVEFVQLSLPQYWDKDMAWAKQKGIDLPYYVKKEREWTAEQKNVLWNITQPHQKIWWPTTFLLDSAGKVVFVQGWSQHWDADEWVSKIRAAGVPRAG